MKLSYREFGHVYKEYTFAYCVYAEREAADQLPDIYQAGFLPHSADLDKKEYFYMARSCRVPLKEFAPSSENRRVYKKFEGQLTKESCNGSVMADNDHFIAFCGTYFTQRHGADIFSDERLRHVLTYSPETLVWTYKDATGTVVAYVVENRSKSMGHYWFSFYDTALTDQSLGMWLMLDATVQAQRDGLAHYYLGTAYGKKALYKTNIQPLEYWTGSQWSPDSKALKEILKSED